MTSIMNNVKDLLPFFLVSWLVFLLSVLYKPYKFRNAIFLMIALLFTAVLISGLFGDNMGHALAFIFIMCLSAIFLVPLMLIFNGITMIKKEGLTFSNLLSIFLGLFIMFGELCEIAGMLSTMGYVFFQKIASFTWIVGNTVLYFSLYMLAFVIYMLFMEFIPHFKDFDYIIIHGCGLINGERISKLLSNRVDKAIAVYNKQHKKPVLVPSGGRGEDEKISEAEAMRRYLVSKGIPESAIIMEDRSTTTMENLSNSIEIINSREGGKRTALVSSNYHVYRCLIYASKLKFKCSGIGARVAWYYWPCATIREFAAVFKQKSYVIPVMIGYIICVILPWWAILKYR